MISCSSRQIGDQFARSRYERRTGVRRPRVCLRLTRYREKSSRLSPKEQQHWDGCKRSIGCPRGSTSLRCRMYETRRKTLSPGIQCRASGCLSAASKWKDISLIQRERLLGGSLTNREKLEAPSIFRRTLEHQSFLQILGPSFAFASIAFI